MADIHGCALASNQQQQILQRNVIIHAITPSLTIKQRSLSYVVTIYGSFSPSSNDIGRDLSFNLK